MNTSNISSENSLCKLLVTRCCWLLWQFPIKRACLQQENVIQPQQKYTNWHFVTEATKAKRKRNTTRPSCNNLVLLTHKSSSSSKSKHKTRKRKTHSLTCTYTRTEKIINDVNHNANHYRISQATYKLYHCCLSRVICLFLKFLQQFYILISSLV